MAFLLFCYKRLCTVVFGLWSRLLVDRDCLHHRAVCPPPGVLRWVRILTLYLFSPASHLQVLISHGIHNKYTDNKNIPCPSHTLSPEELGSSTVKHNKTKDQREVPAVNYLGADWALYLGYDFVSVVPHGIVNSIVICKIDGNWFYVSVLIQKAQSDFDFVDTF